MRFEVRFPDAHFFQEVLDLLFKNVEPRSCICCGHATLFLDFSFPGKAAPICSEDCLISLAERATGKPLGKPDDYRLLGPIE